MSLLTTWGAVPLCATNASRTRSSSWSGCIPAGISACTSLSVNRTFSDVSCRLSKNFVVFHSILFAIRTSTERSEVCVIWDFRALIRDVATREITRWLATSQITNQLFVYLLLLMLGKTRMAEMGTFLAGMGFFWLFIPPNFDTIIPLLTFYLQPWYKNQK